jgi:hypothetical protein
MRVTHIDRNNLKASTPVALCLKCIDFEVLQSLESSRAKVLLQFFGVCLHLNIMKDNWALSGLSDD